MARDRDRPGGALVQAQQESRLHRNFQGYSTQPDRDLVALGVSAIGRIGNTYSQNAKTLPEYYAALHAGRLPVQRGIELSADDLLRRDIFMALMCRGRVEFAAIDTAHHVDMRSAFANELRALQPMVDSGLVQLLADSTGVTPTGWYRAVAMVFDRYLGTGAPELRFSRLL